MKLAKVSEMPLESGVTCLAYGKPGTGKTEFGGSAGNDAVIISVGGGEETLRNPGFIKRKGVNPYIIRLYDEYDNNGVVTGVGFDKVSAVMDDIISNNLNEVKTIVIDDASGLSTMAMSKGLHFNSALRKSNTLDTVVKKHDVVIPVVQDYGAEMSIVSQFIDYYTKEAKRRGFNFLVLAHELNIYSQSKLNETKVLEGVLPKFRGKLAEEIGGYFDWVLRFECIGGGTQTRYQARTIGNEKLIAKVRRGAFPEIVINPNFATMLESFQTETKTN